ncbi:membrane protein [Aureimonas endophytica]|uniref:Membrane protein n=1 Tax=Aureimonas endophytica TaxID=2027858 RepID=A0A917E0Z9_9HYPH|nr:DMT family transporter [Aureimonas endophytica]GGD86758.1 membrane protein [Aureimonas endophytica]
MPSSSPSSASGNLRACLFMLVAMAGFVVNDTCTKLAIADVTAPQIMAIRSLFTVALLLAVAGLRGELHSPRRLAHPVLALRTLADIGATITYIVALGHMPLANASAIFQALPLVMTIGAALFFGEPVGWRRWLAIAVGFVGVVVIVRPGAEGFTVYSILVLLCVLCSAARDLLTRRLPGRMPSLLISAVTAGAVSVSGWLLTPAWGWQPVLARDYAIFATASVAIAVGYVCVVEAMRCGDIGFVSPFRYAILVFAIGMGLLVFGDIPDPTTLLGAAIVVGSGGYSIYRERVRGRPISAGRAQVH